MLETLNGGGSMQPLTPALSLKGGFAKFPFSAIPAKSGPDIGGRGAGIQKKIPARPGHPKAGEWAGIPAGDRVLFAPAARLWKTSVDSRLNLRE